MSYDRNIFCSSVLNLLYVFLHLLAFSSTIKGELFFFEDVRLF